MTETKQRRRRRAGNCPSGGADDLRFAVHDATTATRRTGSLTPIDAVSECPDRHSLIGLMQIKLFTKLRSTPAKRHARTYIEIMAKPTVVRHRSRRQFAEREKYLIYLACIATESRCLGFSAELRPRESEKILDSDHKSVALPKESKDHNEARYR